MTGYRSRFFRYDCAKKGCYYQSLPDWDDLIDCFPRKIRPTDVDGMVEINGHVLFMEQKGCGVSIELGQRLALNSISTRPNVTTLLMRPVSDDPGTSTDLEYIIYGQGPPEGWKRCSREWLKDWLRTWAADADRQERGAS